MEKMMWRVAPVVGEVRGSFVDNDEIDCEFDALILRRLLDEFELLAAC